MSKEPSALTGEDALTVACAKGAAIVQFSTSRGLDNPNQAAGITSMEWLGMFLPACFTLNIATPTDERNLELLPLLLEMLREPEKLPEFAFTGVLYAIGLGIIGRPVVASKLLELGALDVFIDVLQQASPSELIATAGFSRHPHGFAFFAAKELVEACQTTGTDLTAQLLSCGFIDTLVSALSATEEVGADNVHGVIVVWMLWCLRNLDGEALGQIEDKLRAIPSVLHYLVEHRVDHFFDFGFTTSIFATILAANLYAYASCPSHCRRCLPPYTLSPTCGCFLLL
jgi:hypothetical protein